MEAHFCHVRKTDHVLVNSVMTSVSRDYDFKIQNYNIKC